MLHLLLRLEVVVGVVIIENVVECSHCNWMVVWLLVVLHLLLRLGVVVGVVIVAIVVECSHCIGVVVWLLVVLHLLLFCVLVVIVLVGVHFVVVVGEVWGLV